MRCSLQSNTATDGVDATDAPPDGTTEKTVPDDIFDFYEKMDRDEDDEADVKSVSFEINQDMLESLQKRSR